MTIQEYHENKSLGSSLLATLLKNARLFYQIYKEGFKIESKELSIGSALHKLVLEPESFEEEFAILPDINKRTKAGKEAYELFLKENENKIILSNDDFELIKQMKNKLFKLENFNIFIENGIKEQSFFAEIDGVGLKCRPDLLVKTEKGYIVIDLKTSKSEATPDNFAKSSVNFLYPLQEVVYREVLKQNNINVIDFIFAYVSKVEYSEAIYCRHSYDALDWGSDLLNKALFKFKWCLENNIWEEGQFDFINGGFEKVSTISLPNYAYYLY